MTPRAAKRHIFDKRESQLLREPGYGFVIVADQKSDGGNVLAHVEF